MDQAGAALYGLPPTLAVQRLHVGLGHHHLGAGGAHSRLVLSLYRPAEKSTGKRGTQGKLHHRGGVGGYLEPVAPPCHSTTGLLAIRLF